MQDRLAHQARRFREDIFALAAFGRHTLATLSRTKAVQDLAKDRGAPGALAGIIIQWHIRPTEKHK